MPSRSALLDISKAASVRSVRSDSTLVGLLERAQPTLVNSDSGQPPPRVGPARGAERLRQALVRLEGRTKSLPARIGSRRCGPAAHGPTSAGDLLAARANGTPRCARTVGHLEADTAAGRTPGVALTADPDGDRSRRGREAGLQGLRAIEIRASDIDRAYKSVRGLVPALEALADVSEEASGEGAVDEAMVVGERFVHDGRIAITSCPISSWMTRALDDRVGAELPPAAGMTGVPWNVP